MQLENIVAVVGRGGRTINAIEMCRYIQYFWQCSVADLWPAVTYGSQYVNFIHKNVCSLFLFSRAQERRLLADSLIG